MKNNNVKSIFTRYFWIASITVGILLLGITYAISFNYDKKSTETRLTNTTNFIKNTAASYTKYNDTAIARSLIRSEVSVVELRNLDNLEDQESLKEYCDSLWLTGISILDKDGNLVNEYTNDGVGFDRFKDELEFSAISDVSTYLDKTYINRLTLDDSSYIDVAVCGRSEDDLILLAYRHTKEEFKSKSTLSVQNILDGFSPDSNGTIVVVDDTKVVASNDASLLDEDITDNKLIKTIRSYKEPYKLFKTVGFSGSGTVYSSYTHGRQYYIYTYLPVNSMLSTTPRNLIIITIVYLVFIASIQTFRYKSRQDYLAKEALKEEEYKKELEKKNSELELAIEHEAIANKSKREFLFNMSHDIRTPMNAIIGFTSLAATHIDNKEQTLDYLKKISVSSQHLLSLINDVLDMSRIESGKVKIEEKIVHLPDLIHDLKSIIQSNVQSKRLSLLIDTLDIYDEDIITDPLRLNQVLLNILSNAIKFTPSGGTISLQITQKNTMQKNVAEYEFRIKDTGIGMSEQFVDHIFEEFSREESSTVSGVQGTGLGMAIAKKIVDLMDGTIEVNSVQGQGSEFIVKIKFRLSGEKIKHEKIKELEGVRALVADDDTNSCLNVCKMLRTIGLRADWTISGKEAVVRARDALDQGDCFNVYIIDWMIPDMNGVEVVRNIRKFIGEDTPIIILTAYDYADIEKEALEAGVTAFCSKPLFMSELRDILEKPFILKEDKIESNVKFDLKGKKVLLAEDNELNREIACEILKDLKVNVEAVSNGQEAVKTIENHEANYYDLVLMDVQMPVLDGYEATKQIRSLDDKVKANIKIYAMTANAFDEDKRAALAIGMNGHIAKPFDKNQLYKTLKEAFKSDNKA